MDYKFKLTLDLTLAGQKVLMETDYGAFNPKQSRGKSTNKNLLFRGSTKNLNLNLTEILIDLANKVNIDVRDLVPEEYLPEFIVQDIFASYASQGEMNFIAAGKIFGKEILFIFHYTPATNQENKGGFAFSIQSDITDLTSLPMVGKQMEEVKFNGIGFVYTNATLEYKIPTLSSSSSDEARTIIIPKKATSYTKGFNFTGNLVYRKDATPLPLCLPVSGSPAPSKKLPAGKKKAELPAVKSDSDLQPATKWFKLNKKMGPVTVGQIGLRYKDQHLLLLISGQVGIKALTISLNGLGVGFEISKLFKKDFSPSFYLDGIGIAYSAPPIEVSASFLRTQQTIDGKLIDVYNGGAILKASKFTISAIGSYAKVKGKTSLFIYGLYDGPIGGPAFFFVTGIAAGFGYNRKVNIPSLDEVSLFPLVALAMKPEEDSGISGILASLDTPMKNGKRPIEISLGDYWLAVGIKFTSFKIIESFVLLTVNFGTRLEFAILGLSRLKWPGKAILPEPIAYVELAILAQFGPDSDVIAVEAVITPNSYVISKDCKLTGGFAFYTWINGQHESDFVLTLGGYHPKFEKPKHYPDVPRLGLSWKISDVLSIKGEMYFALTPSAIMAGGKWEALFKTSSIKASLVIWADMLIFWAPFQYAIDIGVTVSVEAYVKICKVKIHFNVEVGAQLHLWGPPFAGKVTVNLATWSYTINFGKSEKKKPEDLEWDEFSKSFIPQKKATPVATSRKKTRSTRPLANTKSRRSVSRSLKNTNPGNEDALNITISKGLIDVKGEDKFPVINPYEIAIMVDSFLPVTTLRLNEKPIADDVPMKSSAGDSTYGKRELGIGIQPCGYNAGEVEMKMDVTVTKEGQAVPMTVTCTAKGYAEALWGGQPSQASNSNPGTSKVIQQVLSGLVLTPVPLSVVAQTNSYDFSKLVSPFNQRFTWQFAPPQTGEAYHAYAVLGYYDNTTQQTKPGILETTYMNEKVLAKRKNIYQLLKENLDEDLPEIQDAEINAQLMKNGISYFRAIPVICSTGHIPQYSTDVK